jgi:N-glycosylase/DNA lyase
MKGSPSRIACELDGVRFCNNKSRYIVEVKKRFVSNGNISIVRTIDQFDNNRDARDWLVSNIKGLGYKEASHFLRNIGLGQNLAILDRHILKNLVLYGAIDEIPRSISKKRYFELEDAMLAFSTELGIPPEHLDLLFWYKQTGKIFK